MTSSASKSLLFTDADGDGYGAGPASLRCHGAPVGGDCDDTNPAVHPGAIEVSDPSNVD